MTLIGYQYRWKQEFLDQYPDAHEYAPTVYPTEQEARETSLYTRELLNPDLRKELLPKAIVRPVFAMSTDMSKAPKDRPILAFCVHAADPYVLDDKHLTIYGGHVEGLSHAEDGWNVVVWGGGWADSEEDGGGYMPDWWFVKDSEFERAANPVMWMDLPVVIWNSQEKSE